MIDGWRLGPVAGGGKQGSRLYGDAAAALGSQTGSCSDDSHSPGSVSMRRAGTCGLMRMGSPHAGSRSVAKKKAPINY